MNHTVLCGKPPRRVTVCIIIMRGDVVTGILSELPRFISLILSLRGGSSGLGTLFITNSKHRKQVWQGRDYKIVRQHETHKPRMKTLSGDIVKEVCSC